MDSIKTVLITVLGATPAVLTETVYSLTTSDVIDEVYVITTRHGQDCLKRELFDSGIWALLLEQLPADSRPAFSYNSNHIRLLTSAENLQDADDIITTEDNNLAADLILATIRQFTENPQTKVIFSIAGGRKTMSAISALAMTLLGRVQDRLCHVLVNAPYDNPMLTPKFYFPSNELHTLQDGSEFPGSDATITLCDIPFPRTRYLFENNHGILPGNYIDLVTKTNNALAKTAVMPDLYISPERSHCEIGVTVLNFSIFEFTIYWMLALNAKKQSPPIKGSSQLEEEFKHFTQSITREVMPDSINADLKAKTADDIRKAISSLEKKIRSAITREDGCEYCLCRPSGHRGIYGLSLIPGKITCPSPYH